MFDRLKQAWSEASPNTKLFAVCFVAGSASGLVSGGLVPLALGAAFGVKAVQNLDKDMERAENKRAEIAASGPWAKPAERTPTGPV